MNTFWTSIAAYNAATWCVQPLWLIAAAISVMALWRHDVRAVRSSVRLFMAASSFWLAGIYFMVYCKDRSYHEIEAIVWVLIGALWVYDTFDPKASPDRPNRHNPMAFALLAAPVAYPLFSLMLGRHWPEVMTPLMPCSLAVFMLGLLLGFRERINLILVMLLCHWMLLGIAKTTVFDLPEDYLLVIATLPALWVFFSAYIRRGSARGPMKPSPTLMRILLITVFLLILILCILPLH